MGKLILITGGARSGKSSYAEELAKKEGGDVLYIATSIAFDDEMKHRIIKHREQRPVSWETLEAYKNLDRDIEERIVGKTAVLLDCVTIMVSNLMLERHKDWSRINQEEAALIENYVNVEINKLIRITEEYPILFILVTNEIGMGIVPDNPISRVFRDIAGRINQVLARSADEVFFLVSGLPMKLK